MKPKTNFRKINESERNLIFKTLENISSNISLFFNKNKIALYISLNKSDPNDKYPSVCLISSELSEVIGKSKFKDNIMSAGVYFGF
ncbi:MAG TPA: NIP7 N-terminal domain-related protein, partial [Candidatus Lokiarchaeia archaeon]